LQIEFTHVMELIWDVLAKAPASPDIPDLSEFRRRLMDDFARGFRRFANPPSLAVDAPVRSQSYARAAAISRLHPVQDGTGLWLPGSVSVEPPPLGLYS
jgi:hypothetical protein